MAIEVLQQLGETIPTAVGSESFLETINKTKAKLSGTLLNNLMDMKKIESRSRSHYSLMKFYSQVCFISFFANPPMLKWYASRLVELTLAHGICKYSALGLMQFAIIIDVDRGYMLGKIALKLLERFDSTQDLLPSMYLPFYGHIAVYHEPLQS